MIPVLTEVPTWREYDVPELVDIFRRAAVLLTTYGEYTLAKNAQDGAAVMASMHAELTNQ